MLQFDLAVKVENDHELEKTITKRCLKWARKIPNSKFYKRKGSAYNKGEPDISGCVQGIRIEIEMKSPGNEPTALQASKIKEWTEAGAISGWTDSEEGFIREVVNGLEVRGINLSKGLRECVAKKQKKSENSSMEISLFEGQRMFAKKARRRSSVTEGAESTDN